MSSSKVQEVAIKSKVQEVAIKPKVQEAVIKFKVQKANNNKFKILTIRKCLLIKSTK